MSGLQALAAMPSACGMEGRRERPDRRSPDGYLMSAERGAFKLIRQRDKAVRELAALRALIAAKALEWKQASEKLAVWVEVSDNAVTAGRAGQLAQCASELEKLEERPPCQHESRAGVRCDLCGAPYSITERQAFDAVARSASSQAELTIRGPEKTETDK